MCIRDRFITQYICDTIIYHIYHPVSGLQVLIPAIFFDFEVRGREELEKFTSGIRQGRLGLFYTAKSGRCSAKFGYGYGLSLIHISLAAVKPWGIPREHAV